MKHALLAFLALLILVTVTTAQMPAWDPRLDALNVTLQPATNCAPGCWRLVSAQFEDADESGGQHHVFGRMLLPDGSAPGGLEWHVLYPDGDIVVQTKPAPEWGDVAIYAEYDPDEGESGPYWAYAGNDVGESDIVRGMGLPERQHVVFRLIWQWQVGDSTPTPIPTPLPYQLYLPVIRSEN